MVSWAAKMSFKIEINKMEVCLFKKYVDDVNLYISSTRRSNRWNGERIEGKD